MKTPEKFEKDDICKWLDRIGAWYFKPATGGFGKSGVPDIVGCYRSCFFSIEVKREGKEPTVLQWRRINEITEAGGIATWGTADRAINELKTKLALHD